MTRAIAVALLFTSCASPAPQRVDDSTLPQGEAICTRQEYRPVRGEWKRDRRETEFVTLDIDVPPCTPPGGKLRIRIDTMARSGIGCWDDAGIGVHSIYGRGVLVEEPPPRIVASEGGEVHATSPHFESAEGPWGIDMRHFRPYGPWHRMMFEAVAQIRPDAKPRTIELEIEVSADRNDFAQGVSYGVFTTRTVKTRIGC